MKRFSPQRQAVLEAVSGTFTHPTADWIYDEVRKTFPRISLGTVYRNLGELKEEGLIVGFTDSSGVERYDGTVCSHLHFQCTECGKLLDVPEITLDTKENKVSESLGAEVSGAVFLYLGKCAECKEIKK